jgi:hypothetical protein
MSLQHGGVECKTREQSGRATGSALSFNQRVAGCRSLTPAATPDFHAASTLNQMGHSSCSTIKTSVGRRRRLRAPTTRQAARRPSEITSPARHFGTAALDEVL